MCLWGGDIPIRECHLVLQRIGNALTVSWFLKCVGTGDLEAGDCNGVLRQIGSEQYVVFRGQ